MIKAAIIKDSVNVCGNRLMTFVVSMPKHLVAELNTHRMMSRNSASSRAVPFNQMKTRTKFVPYEFRKKNAGMQGGDFLEGKDKEVAEGIWTRCKEACVGYATELDMLGVHKNYPNRLIEPFLYTKIIISTTSFKHFELLRNSLKAEDHFRMMAEMMVDQVATSKPTLLLPGEWHIPFDEPNCALMDRIKIAIGRCARVSYFTHDGVRDIAKDIELHDTLSKDHHWSPFEHVAQADSKPIYHGNFRGWKQARKLYPEEFIEDEPYFSAPEVGQRVAYTDGANYDADTVTRIDGDYVFLRNGMVFQGGRSVKGNTRLCKSQIKQ